MRSGIVITLVLAMLSACDSSTSDEPLEVEVAAQSSGASGNVTDGSSISASPVIEANLTDDDPGTAEASTTDSVNSPIGIWVGKTVFGDDVASIPDNSTGHGIMVIDENEYVYSISETAHGSTRGNGFKAQAVFGPINGQLEQFWHPIEFSDEGFYDTYESTGNNINRTDPYTEYNLVVDDQQYSIYNDGLAGEFTMYKPFHPLYGELVQAISIPDVVGNWSNTVSGFYIGGAGGDIIDSSFSITIDADGSFYGSEELIGFQEFGSLELINKEKVGTVSATTVSDRYLHVSFTEDGRPHRGVLFRDAKYPGTLTILATGPQPLGNQSISSRMRLSE